MQSVNVQPLHCLHQKLLTFGTDRIKDTASIELQDLNVESDLGSYITAARTVGICSNTFEVSQQINQYPVLLSEEEVRVF